MDPPEIVLLVFEAGRRKKIQELANRIQFYFLCEKPHTNSHFRLGVLCGHDINSVKQWLLNLQSEKMLKVLVSISFGLMNYIACN
jgi:hypothetical protein